MIRSLPLAVLKRFRKSRRQHIGKRCRILDLLAAHPVLGHVDQFGPALAADDLTQLPARGCGVQLHVRYFKAFDCQRSHLRRCALVATAVRDAGANQCGQRIGPRHSFGHKFLR